MGYEVSLRVDDDRVNDDAQLLLRLGTDADVDQTIKASLGHYLSLDTPTNDVKASSRR